MHSESAIPYQRSSSSGFGSFASSSSLNCASMWKNAARAELVGAVLPRVIGSALHDHVALLDGDLAVIEKEHELSLDHDDVVERPRSVHCRAFAASLQWVDIENAQEMPRDGHDREVAFVGLARLNEVRIGTAVAAFHISMKSAPMVGPRIGWCCGGGPSEMTTDFPPHHDQ